MVEPRTVLTAALLGGSLVTGIMAVRLLLQASTLRTGAKPPFPYGDATLRDFELLSAAEGLLLFGSFVALTAGLYEIRALQVAARVPAILFTLLLIGSLYRWRRRVQ